MNKIEDYQIEIRTNKDINILIITDNFDTDLKSILIDYNLIIKENCSDALTDISLIILNIENKNFELLNQIKSKTNIEIPIILSSNHYTQSLIQDAYRLGINDFLHKPFIKEEVLYKIKNIFKQEFFKNELKYNLNLMKEYKMAIDRSTIVSKTNKHGVITYVNDAFSNISGYTSEELIGQAHNIVKHSDMNPEIYKELWETISSKKTWKGILKNRKKDGSYYWVNTVINPIVDIKGNLIEYISIRSDVTYLQDIKEKLSEDLKITTSNFKEAYQLAQEYEKAIDESNILSRTNLKGEIIYANKEFERVTGYSSIELIGKTHRIVKHPDTSKETINDLWKTITSGNIWKGLIKNKAKNGNPYWVNSVILPIKNSSGKIVEYLSIRNDVTEIIQLHKEIENTQKELIYRMGEIAESRSKETGNHIKRVAAYAKVLANAYGLSEKDSEILAIASPMHDIGKLSTPDSILKKPGKLNEEEWQIMKQHAQVGFELLNSDKPILKAAAIIAHEHHEKWDGNGYPRGLKGEEIHIFGRIIAIADVFDALGSERYYKKKWEDEDIFKYFEEKSGKDFDPTLIKMFFENLKEILEIRENYKDII